MIGSPSGEIGIGPLMRLRIPISLSDGMRSAAGTMTCSNRSKFDGSSSRPNSKGTPREPNGTVFFSQPPTTSAPTSGFR